MESAGVDAGLKMSGVWTCPNSANGPAHLEQGCGEKGRQPWPLHDTKAGLLPIESRLSHKKSFRENSGSGALDYHILDVSWLN